MFSFNPKITTEIKIINKETDEVKIIKTDEDEE